MQFFKNNNNKTDTKMVARDLTIEDLPSVGLMLVLLLTVLLISGVASGI